VRPPITGLLHAPFTGLAAYLPLETPFYRPTARESPPGAPKSPPAAPLPAGLGNRLTRTVLGSVVSVPAGQPQPSSN